MVFREPGSMHGDIVWDHQRLWSGTSSFGRNDNPINRSWYKFLRTKWSSHACFWVHNNVSTLKYPEGVEPTNHDTMMMMRDIKLWPVSWCITTSLPWSTMKGRANKSQNNDDAHTHSWVTFTGRSAVSHADSEGNADVSALFRMPRTQSTGKRRARIMQLLDQLGLVQVADSIIGDAVVSLTHVVDKESWEKETTPNPTSGRAAASLTSSN